MITFFSPRVGVNTSSPAKTCYINSRVPTIPSIRCQIVHYSHHSTDLLEPDSIATWKSICTLSKNPSEDQLGGQEAVRKPYGQIIPPPCGSHTCADSLAISILSTIAHSSKLHLYRKLSTSFVQARSLRLLIAMSFRFIYFASFLSLACLYLIFVSTALTFPAMHFSRGIPLLSSLVPAFASSAPDLSTALQNIINEAHQPPLYTYPTSLTQGIIPVSGMIIRS